MWCVKLKDSEIGALRVLVKSQEEASEALAGALEALELARWDELPDAELPWEELEQMAAVQGVGVADVFWDRAGRAAEPPAPSAQKEQARRRRRARKKARK